jgi:hypothetical protein
MREVVSEKIRQKFIVKSLPNLFWQEIRQIIRPQSRSSRPGFTYSHAPLPTGDLCSWKVILDCITFVLLYHLRMFSLFV